MKRLFSLILILAFCLPCALAQSTADDTPATKEDVEKLFATLHLRDQMRQVMDLSMKQSSQAARDALKKKIPDLTQKDMDRIDAMMDRVMKSVDMNGMLDDMIPVYQRHLSKVDVAAMEAFYETPTGQKMLREQPAMMAEAMKAVQPRVEKMMASIMDEAEKAAKEAAAESKPANDTKQ